MPDSTTTASPIPALKARRRWARHQLHASMRNVPLTSILRKSLSTPGGGPGKAERGCWRSQGSMADSSSTAQPILIPSLGRHGAQRQLHAGIKRVLRCQFSMELYCPGGGKRGGGRGKGGGGRGVQ